jgi:hypothetical protein
MIYPASYNVTILQNSTWRGEFRATQERQELSRITVSGNAATFEAYCHGLVNGDKVVFTIPSEASNQDFISNSPSATTSIPCGLQLNSIYYVIASGLTNDFFKVSTSSGGTQISVTGNASGTFYVAKPLVISGYGIDADVKQLTNDEQVATFVCTITDAVNGSFKMEMAPSVTSGIAAGNYGYDVSFTTAGGDRYYWLQGTATVQRTYSRNDS